MAEAPLSLADVRATKATLESRFGELKVITVDVNPKALIVRADEPSVRLLRRDGLVSVAGGVRLTPVLTSGVIGKLKKRAAGAAANGKVHER